MFLEFIHTLMHILKYIICFIEEYPVLIGIITSVVTGSIWFRKYIRQKRAEAFFGFYTKLSLRLKSLQTILEENGQLNISDPQKGNIYSLIYTENFIKDVCPSYKVPEPDELKLYISYAKELKQILLNTENNVYPKGTKREEWYENQHILFLFCEFLENEEYHHRTNEEFDTENASKHIKKCKILVNAMNSIQESINYAKY